MKTYKVLSIDAWADTEPNSWTWNQWFNAGTIEIEDLENDMDVLSTMQYAGYINKIEGNAIEDDGFNLVIVDAKTREPFFAIEYGSTI